MFSWQKVKFIIVAQCVQCEDGLTENGQMTLSNPGATGCGATLQELSHAALDRQRWATIVIMASDTNGH